MISFGKWAPLKLIIGFSIDKIYNHRADDKICDRVVQLGNLAISYDGKTQLINEGRLSSEITRRLALP